MVQLGFERPRSSLIPRQPTLLLVGEDEADPKTGSSLQWRESDG